VRYDERDDVIWLGHYLSTYPTNTTPREMGSARLVEMGAVGGLIQRSYEKREGKTQPSQALRMASR
jgi:hypothetical protein